MGRFSSTRYALRNHSMLYEKQPFLLAFNDQKKVVKELENKKSLSLTPEKEDLKFLRGQMRKFVFRYGGEILRQQHMKLDVRFFM